MHADICRHMQLCPPINSYKCSAFFFECVSLGQLSASITACLVVYLFRCHATGGVCVECLMCWLGCLTQTQIQTQTQTQTICATHDLVCGAKALCSAVCTAAMVAYIACMPTVLLHFGCEYEWQQQRTTGSQFVCEHCWDFRQSDEFEREAFRCVAL